MAWAYWHFELVPKYGPRKLLKGKVEQIGDDYWFGYPGRTKDIFDDEQFETDEQYLKRVKPGN